MAHLLGYPTEGQLARWIEKLQEYNFYIVHRPGKKHSNADSLSRLPCNQCGRDNDHPTNVASVSSTSETFILQQFSPETFRKSQLDDQSVGIVLRALELKKNLIQQHFRVKVERYVGLFN